MPAKKKPPKRADNRFEIKRTVGYNIDGSAIRKSFYSTKSKADAEKQYQQYMVDKGVANQMGVGFVNKEITFKEWAYTWLETYKKPDVAPQTYAYTYKSVVDKHLIPFFGDMQISKIYPLQVKQFFAKNQHYSHALLSRMRMILNGIFETAIDNDLCFKNPCKYVKFKSTHKKDEKQVYSETQIKRVCEIALFSMPEIALLLETGFRRGELLGLKWEDISFTEKTISVNRSVADVPGNGVVIGPPKWNSYRTNPLSDNALKILKRIKRTSDYVFPKKNGEPQSPKKWSEKADTFMESLPVDIPRLSPHELRHTYGTHLKRKGVDIYAIQKIMGHKDVKITSEIYVHNEIETLRDALKQAIV